jgi:hypothetical protein
MATIGSLNLALTTSMGGLISGFRTAESVVANSSAKMVSSANKIVAVEDKIAQHAAGVSKMGGGGGLFGGLFAGLGETLGPLAATALGIFSISKSISAANEDARAFNKLNAVFKSTGNTTGFTVDQLTAMATGLQKVTNFADETTVSAMATLASFKNISGDIFKGAVISAQDLTEAIGGDLQANIFTIGQILQDPIMNMKKLKGLGIDVTDTFKSQITAMQQSGNMAGAQAAILGQLQTKFGGTAQAVANPITQMENKLNDVAEAFGRVLLPIVGLIKNELDPIADLLAGAFDAAVPAVTAFTGLIWSTVTSAFQAISDFVMPLWEATTSFLSSAFATAYDFVAPILAELVAIASTAFAVIQNAAASLWDGMIQVFTSIGTFISDTFASIGVNTQTFVDLFTWLRTGVETALIAVEFAFQNWQALGELALVGLELGVVTFANQVVYFFSEALPAYLSFFNTHWMEIFTNIVNFTATVASNIWINIKSLWDSILGLFQGDGWDFTPTNLLKGWKTALTEMPIIAERQIGAMEKGLGDKFGMLGQQVGQSFNDFAANRMSALPGEGKAFQGKFAGIGAAPKLAIAGVGPLAGGGSTADNIAAGGGEKLGALVRGSKEAYQAGMNKLVGLAEQQVDHLATIATNTGGEQDQIVDDF